MGIPTRAFSSAEEFLEFYADDPPGCLVTDFRMFGMNGIELQEHLAKQESVLPVILLTAFARTQLTVRAIKNGAVTMLDKPYNDDELWDAVRRGLTVDRQRRERRLRQREILQRIESLSESETKVMELVIAGVPNKVIANRLAVSVRTVENRRHEIFRKMQAESVAELVRLVMEGQEEPLVSGDTENGPG